MDNAETIYQITSIQGLWRLVKNAEGEERAFCNTLEQIFRIYPDAVINIRPIRPEERDEELGSLEEGGVPGIHHEANTIITFIHKGALETAYIRLALNRLADITPSQEVFARLSPEERLILGVAKHKPEAITMPEGFGSVVGVAPLQKRPKRPGIIAFVASLFRRRAQTASLNG